MSPLDSEIVELDPSLSAVNPETGLGDEEVLSRRKAKQTNRVRKVVSKSYPRILFDNFANPFNVLLCLVTALMIWGRLSFTNFIFAFVFGTNIAIGIYEDIHARHLIDKLKVFSEDKYKVLRNGIETLLPREEIVLGDVILLEAGDQVPADLVLLQGNCSCDESLLTGESRSQSKGPRSILYSGSFIKKGHCKAQAARVGESCYAEQLHRGASKFKRPKSEVAQSVWNITAICTIIALAFGIIYTMTMFLRGEVGWGDLFPMGERGSAYIAGMSGAMVAMLPTGMFLLTSTAMTVAVISLSKKNILVHELYCIENLARVDVLCFDKTGTLTDGKMSVTEIVPFNHSSEGAVQFAISALLMATKDDNPTARALADRCGRRVKAIVRNCIPFSSDSKYSAATIEDYGTVVMGANEFIKTKPCPEAQALLRSYEKKGFRCLILARSENAIKNGVLPKDLEICAVLVLLDHIKEDAKANVEWFKDNGVAVYVISGDNPVTVAEIARQCGVERAEDYIDMSTVKDEDIPSIVDRYRVFGRVLPEQKEKLVLALQKAGHKVAMTGDGVNDVLALKVADCSIAMASGSSAAKAVAHLVCTKSDFSSLPDVVAQGRRVINNLERSCSLFLNKTVFAMLVSTAFLISVICGGRSYPFTPANMLIWEIFSIGIPSFFLALQPNKERVEGTVTKTIFTKALPLGICEALCVGVAFLFFATIPNVISPYGFPADDVISLAVIAFTTFSYVALFRLCMPLNKYRAIVFFTSLTVSVVFYVIDFLVRDGNGFGVLFHFSWRGMGSLFPLLLIGTLLIAFALYMLLLFIFEIRPRKRRNEQ